MVSEQQRPSAAVNTGSTVAYSPTSAAPGTRITYHPELIEQLRQGHMDLLSLLASMEQLALAKNLSTALAQIPSFKRTLHAHLLLENVRLYVYLEHLLPRQHPNRSIVRSIRHAMDAVTVSANAFFERYLQPSASANAPQFLQDLDNMAQLLVSQVQQEEDSLYPLYQPS